MGSGRFNCWVIGVSISDGTNLGISANKIIAYNLRRLFREPAIMRGSEFAELKAFAAVVERASFARAAHHLGLSASALMPTIRQLETQPGILLRNTTIPCLAPNADW